MAFTLGFAEHTFILPPTLAVQWERLLKEAQPSGDRGTQPVCLLDYLPASTLECPAAEKG